MTTGRRAPAALPIGILGRPHGVRGDITFRVYNPDSDLFDRLDPPFALQLLGPAQAAKATQDASDRHITVEGIRAAGDHYLLEIVGVHDREAAALLTNQIVAIARDLLGPLQPGEFFAEDLLGCEVLDQDGATRGTVQSLFWNGAHHVITVIGPGGETLLPMVSDYVVKIDSEGGRLHMLFLEPVDAEGPG